MADRYWVGGTGTWDGTNTANWSTGSGGSSGASVPTAADNVFFDANSNTGTNAFTVTMATSPRVCNDITISGLDGAMTLAGAGIGLTVSGSLSFPATNLTVSYTGTTTFNSTATGKTITTNGNSFSGAVTFNGVGGGWQLQDNLTIPATAATTLTNGALDLNGKTLTTGTFSSSNSNTRSIAFGSVGSIVLTSTAGGNLLLMGTATNFTYTGTSNITRDNTTAGGNIAFGSSAGATASNVLNFNLTAGSNALTITANSSFNNFVCTGSSCVVSVSSGVVNFYGNLTCASGGTYTSLDCVFRGAGTITSAGKSIQRITINASGSTVTLGDDLTTTDTGDYLTAGTLNLNDFTLTTKAFISNNSNTRSVAFGTSGKFTCNGGTTVTTVLDMATATNFTFTGTSNVTAPLGSARTFNFGGTAGATTSNRLNINFTTGSAIPTFTGSFRQINFTNTTSNPGAVTISCHGFTLASGGTYTSTNFTTVGDGTLTFATKSISTLNVNTSGITTTLSDSGTTATLTLTNGTLNLAGFTLTCTTTAATAAGTKDITFNGGTLSISASGATAWNNAQPTGFTTTSGTGTGSISMTSASAKTFVGGSSTYNCALNQGGAGTLTITGANTFNDITNTNATASQITFPASTTTTVNAFTLSGTAGNLVSIRSSTPATQFTLSDSSGLVNVSYLNIQDSNATGGATWNAFTSNGNINNGNNTGWNFVAVSGFFIFFAN